MKILFPLFSPEDDKTGAGVLDEKPALGKPDEKEDDTTELMASLIGDKDIIDLDEQEKDEEKEEKEEVDEEPELEIEIDTNSRGVDLGKVKEKYPEFAKTNEFRELRNAYHREAQYTELFPTLEDAKEAAENNETYNKLNTDLIERGDTVSLLNAIREANPESYRKVALTFLDNISKQDQNLFVEAISPVVKRLARQIQTEGQKYLKRNPESDEGRALVATARNIMQFAFDDADAIDKDDPKPSTEPSEREKELERREGAIKQEKFNSAYKTAANSVMHNLDKQILAGLDPDGKLNDFIKDSLLEKIKKEVTGQIDKDSVHVRRMTSLWKRAETEDYSRESLSRIVAAYLERARPIIPTARNKYRSIAIKGSRVTDDGENENKDKDLKLVNRGRSGRAPSHDGKVNIRNVDPKKIDYRNTSDDDIFEGKVKLKAH